MNKKQAIEIAHTLSKPGKMPCASYSLPATACKTGSKLRAKEGTVCSKCYAHKGCYGWPSTQAAMAKRLAAIEDPRWVDAMVTLIGDSEYFRWHDSGDIQSEEHLCRIMDVCIMTPHCQHWLPTKEISLVDKTVADIGCPANLTIRRSAPIIDGDVVKKRANDRLVSCRTVTHPSITREAKAHLCTAPLTEGKCGDCRACWNPDVYNVDYLLH